MNLKSNNNRKLILIATHVLVWLVLFSLPYILSAGTEFNLQRTLKHSTIPLVYYAIIFYTNYFILLERFWFSSDKKLYFFISNMLIIGFFIIINYNIKQHFFVARHAAPPFRLFLYVDIISMIIPVLFSIGLKTYERWIESEAINRQATNEKLISELQHLKYQLQPHFFFNSLNNIYSLIDRYPEKAKEVVHSLGKLMRYLLYETNVETVSLSKEIDFMKRYIELMQLRTSENTSIHIDFQPIEEPVEVAPLLFISLIENAFKHGVSATQKSDINFNMYIHKEQIIFTTKNLYIPKDTSDKSGSGIGLDNLEKRLKLLYPNAHEFRNEIKDGIYHSILAIQFKKTLA